MRTLDQEQKPNWPVYLPSFVFTYNATPHNTTDYQPYELMFGHKAPMPCDNWLGLNNYKPASFKSKTAWPNEQLNAMLYSNKQALKGIHKSTKCNKDHTGGKDITTPVGNHVLLHDYLEGWQQDSGSDTSLKYMSLLVITKNQMFTIFNSWTVVNQVNPRWSTDISSMTSKDLSLLQYHLQVMMALQQWLSFLNRWSIKQLSDISNSNDPYSSSHHYSTQSKCKAATTVSPVVVETIVTHL